MPPLNPAPQGFPPLQDQGFAPAFPGQGEINQRLPQYRQNIQTKTPGFFQAQGGGDRPSAAGFAGPAPQITQGPVWNQQQINEQVNQQKAQAHSGQANQMRQMDAQLARQGVSPNSPQAQAMRNQLIAQTTAQNAQMENNLRFQTAQANASHLLNTQNAASGQHFQGLNDEMARRQLANQTWLAQQGLGVQESQLAAQMADQEAQRQQQAAMSNLGFGQDVYKMGLANDYDLGRLSQQFNFQGSQNQADRELALTQQGNQLGFSREQLQAQMGDSEAQRQLQERMQQSQFGFQGEQAGLERQFTGDQAAQQRAFQNYMAQQGYGFEGQQAAMNRQQETAMQIRSIEAQMAQLGNQLAQEERNSERSAQLQMALQNLGAQRDMMMQGVAGQQALQRQMYSDQSALQRMQQQQQYDSWAQQFGMAGTFAQQGMANQQQDYMARLQDAMARRAWGEQADFGLNRDLRMVQANDWANLRQIQEQGRQQQINNRDQFDQALPFNMREQMNREFQAQTQRMPYTDEQMNREAFARAQQIWMQGVGEQWGNFSPSEQASELSNMLQLLRYGYGFAPRDANGQPIAPVLTPRVRQNQPPQGA